MEEVPGSIPGQALFLSICVYFDVHFEASGNENAVRSGLEVLKPRSVLVQLGLGGDVSIPQNLVVAKEIEMRGTFRFHEEFALAVDLINARRVDLKPLMSGTFPIADAVAARRRRQLPETSVTPPRQPNRRG